MGPHHVGALKGAGPALGRPDIGSCGLVEEESESGERENLQRGRRPVKVDNNIFVTRTWRLL